MKKTLFIVGLTLIACSTGQKQASQESEETFFEVQQIQIDEAKTTSAEKFAYGFLNALIEASGESLLENFAYFRFGNKNVIKYTADFKSADTLLKDYEVAKEGNEYFFTSPHNDLIISLKQIGENLWELSMEKFVFTMRKLPKNVVKKLMTKIQEKEHFAQTAKAVVEAVAERNTQKLRSLVHPEIGLYVIIKLGIASGAANIGTKFLLENEHIKHITDDGTSTYLLPLQKGYRLNQPLQFADKLPGFDCLTARWNFTGFYANLDKPDFSVLNAEQSSAMVIAMEMDPKEVKFLEDLGKKSRRVILVDNQAGHLVFSLTLINGKWYLSAIDLQQDDCSL